MIFLTTNYKNVFFINKKLIYFIKLFDDFVFFISLFKEYITLYKLSSVNYLKNSIYLLNLLSLKYILYIKHNNIFYLNDYNIYKIYILELFYWKYKNVSKYKRFFQNNIEQKILLINKISKTREKGRIKRYKVIILIGDKSGWFGIGYSKNYYLQEALSNARLHAFKNIYQVSLFYSNLLKDTIHLQKKSKNLYLFPSTNKLKLSSNYFIRILFDFIGLNNITSKIIGIHNIYNILSLILRI